MTIYLFKLQNLIENPDVVLVAAYTLQQAKYLVKEQFHNLFEFAEISEIGISIIPFQQPQIYLATYGARLIES